ncbi:HPr family phosphocarrier protein [Buchnera aphidicola]|uniref:Phosphocarrier protein HPr n=1 Tax=Buchnera aphidicola (Sarucallis kahawaluokalani) TaxID=1241878 RepID=A0A4D6Y7H8_9GAMM|nr:HPr family phosphocarrier protein [Buchnera aphidicola]QCI25856.1 HPr family phosphocarrier protein [Buchnera aphidicola (Sarucallis kahawaluokalani)]
MFQKNVIITTPNGLHTRPAAKFVKSAQKFKSDITVTSNKISANAKSLFQLQTLDLTQNNSITITANGIDEVQSVEYLIQFLKKLK